MPRVPTYDNFQTQETVTPNVQLQAPSGPTAGGIAAEQGAQMGRAVQSAGDVVNKLALAEAEKANADRVNAQTVQLDKARTSLMVEAMGFTGRAALERPDGKSLQDEYSEKLDKVAKSLADGLGNDAQRALFAQRAAATQNHLLNTLGSHVIQQSKQFRADTRNATIGQAVEDASTLWGDKTTVENSTRMINATVDEIIKDNGWDAEKDKALISQTRIAALSPLHAGILNGMLKGDSPDVAAARAYFGKHSAELTPQVRLQMHDAINIGDFEKRAQDKTDALVAKYGDDTAGALKEVRSTMSGKDEDAVVTRIKAIDAERVALRERAQADAADKAWRIYATTGSLRKIDSTILAAMDGKALESLRKTAKADAEAGAAGRKTDIAKWLEFTNLGQEQMAMMSPQDLLTKYGHYFSDQSLKEANSMMLGVKGLKGKGKPDEVGLQLFTTTDLVKRSAVELGILPPKGTLTPQNEADYTAFTEQIQQKVNAWEASHKKKATPEDLSTILNEAKMDVVKLNVWGPDSEKPLMAVKTDELGKAYVTVGTRAAQEDIPLSTIPQGYRAQAIARRQARGLPITEKAIAEMWVADKRPKE